jgi:hypothetical protein
MNNTIDCPIENVMVNEVRVRIIAFIVLLLAILYLITDSWIIIALLLIDFALRAFNYTAYSPLSLISGVIVKKLKLKNKPVDRAPKRFAAIVGTTFLAIILVSITTDMLTASKLITVILIVFASLESFAGFCAGCYVYSFLKRIKAIS